MTRVPYVVAIMAAVVLSTTATTRSTTRTSTRPAAERSEERRVGKECRSLCDWSSDVCSSDLNDPRALRRRDHGRSRPLNHGYDTVDHAHIDEARGGEIGRASCRERV